MCTVHTKSAPCIMSVPYPKMESKTVRVHRIRPPITRGWLCTSSSTTRDCLHQVRNGSEYGRIFFLSFYKIALFSGVITYRYTKENHNKQNLFKIQLRSSGTVTRKRICVLFASPRPPPDGVLGRRNCCLLSPAVTATAAISSPAYKTTKAHPPSRDQN